MTLSSIRQTWYSRLISASLITTFITTMVIIPKASYAGVMGLPQPGAMVNLSPAYVPLMVTGLTIHPENPLLMDFILSTGNSGLNANQVKIESDRLIKYFLACLTIPENNQWVNLSPYEKQRIIPEDLGQTVLGQDMLAQDYILKQLTASLIYPEKNLGKNFWDKVYAKANEMYGTTQIPVNTFNKVWILPDTAKVYEHKNTVFVVKSHLTVMLDEDYLALSKHSQPKGVNNLGNQIIREVVLPAIETEVNTGKNFAQLRQIYNSMILAVWFKKNLKQALLNQVYTDKSKVNGVNVDDPAIKERIYKQYIQAYKKGVFNYIKEEINQSNQQVVPRKYFSGGITPETKVEIASGNEAMAAFEAAPAGNVVYDESILTQGAKNSNAAMNSVETRDQFDALESSLISDLFPAGERDENMFGMLKERIVGALDKIYENRQKKIGSTAKGRRVIVNKDDPSFDPTDPQDGAEDVNVGILAISANPVHWGQLETALRAMAEQNLDQVVIIVQGDDFRKPILKKTEDDRHQMVKDLLSRFGGLLVYSDWSKGNRNIGEDSTGEMILRNIEAGRTGKVTWHYIVGSDHGHWWAPDAKSADAKGFRSLPKGKEGQFEEDTIQRLYKWRRANVDALKKSGDELKIALNVREDADGQWMDVEKDQLEAVSHEGFFYNVEGRNLPGTSSTKLREVLSGQRNRSEATFIMMSMYDYIMEHGHYRGLITDLPQNIRLLADAIQAGKTFSEKENKMLDQLGKWIEIEKQRGHTITPETFYHMFFEGIDQDQVDATGHVLQKAEPELYVTLDGVRQVFQKGYDSGHILKDKAITVQALPLVPTEKIRPVKFGTSGDRWVEQTWAEQGIDSADHLNRIGTGIAETFNQETPGKIMLIGFDPRQRNLESAKALASLYAANGIKVKIIDAESTPTPVLALMANHDENIGGVTILTASHSPWTDRGIKFSPSHGGAAPKEMTDRIQEFANRATEYKTTDYEKAKESGLITEVSPEEAQRIYVDEYVVPKLKEIGAWDDIVNYIKGNPNFEMVLDPMQGTGVRYLKAIYEALSQAAGRDFYTMVNTDNHDIRFLHVNGEPNPTLPDSRKVFVEAVKAKIAEGKQVMGASVDTDSDRFGNIDSNGEFVPANDMIALIAYFLKKEIGLDGAIGKTVATSNFTNAIAQYLHVDIDEEAVGFKNFVNNVVTKGQKYLVAGEESSHVAVGPFMDSWDDGFVVGLMGLWITARTGKSLTEYKDFIQKQLDQKFVIDTKTERGKDDSIKDGLNAKIALANSEIAQGIQLNDLTIVKELESQFENYDSLKGQKIIDIITKDGVKLVLESGDWILMRPSGTEPAVKLYVEVVGKYASSLDGMKHKFDQLVAVGRKIIGANAAMSGANLSIDKLIGFIVHAISLAPAVYSKTMTYNNDVIPIETWQDELRARFGKSGDKFDVSFSFDKKSRSLDIKISDAAMRTVEAINWDIGTLRAEKKRLSDGGIRSKSDSERLTNISIELDGLQEELSLAQQSSPLGNVDRAALTKSEAEPGGIDLNSKNLKMESSGDKVNITFDAAQVAAFRRGDFSGVQFHVIDVEPINLMPLLGLGKEQEAVV